MTTDRYIPGERGSAMSLALIGLLLISIVMGVVITSTIGSIDRIKNKSVRLSGMDTADRAIIAYQYALQAKSASEGTYFAVSRSGLEQAVVDAAVADGFRDEFQEQAVSQGLTKLLYTSKVIKNSALPASFKEIGLHKTLLRTIPNQNAKLIDQYGYSVREQTGPDRYGYWQLYEIVQPDYTSPDAGSVIAYIRAWTSNRSGKVVTDPTILRVELRPGRFSDFQNISDGPLNFPLNDTVINGPVHSNGYRDSFNQHLAPGIHVGKKVKCTGAAGFSTAQGELNIKGPCGNKNKFYQRKGTRAEISFLRVEESYDLIRKNAASARGPEQLRRAFLVNWGKAPYHVKLGARQLIVSDANGRRATYRVGGNYPDVRAFLFTGDVSVEGKYRGGKKGGRITIAARSRNNVDKAADIELLGTTDGFVGGVDVERDIVGFIAEGSIVLGGLQPQASARANRRACLKNIQAAMVAESGSVTVPVLWRTAIIDQIRTSSLPKCTKEVNVKGSIAGHFGSAFFYEWGATGDTELGARYVGYRKRSYRYNKNLYKNPPPFFPLSGPWQVIDWSDANIDCLKGAKLEATCQ